MALRTLLHGRLRSARNSGRLFRRQSTLKIVFIVVFATGLFLGLGGLFYGGFRFLHALGGPGLMVIQRLFALFFLGLAFMLFFSSIVTSYATMYRSDEVPSLLVRPVPLGDLALYKYLESAVFSSWAFFFMIVPFIGAYALHQHLGPGFAIWTFLFSVPFVLLCSALGTIVCMVLVRTLPGGRALYLLVGGGALIALALLGRTLLQPVPAQDEAALVLTRLIPGLRLSSHPLLPSYWIGEGIMALARGDWVRGGMLWLVLVSNTLVAAMAIEFLGRRLFYAGWLRGMVATAWGRPRAVTGLALHRLLPAGRRDVRALLLKDLRMFLRDPVQWTQMLVFFGLLALYFLNLRQLHYHLLAESWRNLIAFLNMMSVAAVVCSLSSRFVFPQMSLEGHSFWILGLSPLSAARVLRTKFALAAVNIVLVSATLALISTAMLQVEPALRVLAVALAGCIGLAVTGLSVGLGAVFMDLKERNPAAIVSSFGGTLNLVLGMGFTLGAIVPFAGLFHLRALGRIGDGPFHLALAGGIVLLLAATVLAVRLPLRAGRLSLLRREF